MDSPTRRFFVGVVVEPSYRIDAARRWICSGYSEAAGEEDGRGVKLNCVWRFLRVDFRG